MSKGKPTPQSVIELVRSFWLTNQGESGSEIHRIFERKHGKGLISKRKVQQLVTHDFKKPKGGEPKEDFPSHIWGGPWENKHTDAATTAFLNRLTQAAAVILGRHLHQIEADWAERLRVCLRGLSIHNQLQIVRLYVAREVSGYYFDTEPMTEDLDAMCAYMPWRAKNLGAYTAAIYSGLVPIPVLDGVDLTPDWYPIATGEIWSFGKEFIRPPQVIRATVFDENIHGDLADEVRSFWNTPPSPIDLDSELEPPTAITEE